MIDPRAFEQASRLLAAGAPPAGDELDTRSGQGRIYFSAMIWSLRNPCDCDACRLLRESADSLLVQPKR
jgi:hypothetical protein